MTTTLDLVPGLVTTREAIAAAYGCGTYQGIEPADDAGKVFVYSDPAAGAEYGYTFDGRAEDDEYGPLYTYTGAGTKGDQQPTGRNTALLTHVAKGRELHLFVAQGKRPKRGGKKQRYIGQMVLDTIKPYDVRRAPGKDGVMRNVLVFRFRPAEGTTPAWTETDRVHAATKDSVEIIDPADVVAKPAVVPAKDTTKIKKNQQHNTAETIANITARQRKVLFREAELVTAFLTHLKDQGHQTHSFQFTVEGEPGSLTPDVYDATDHVLFEAKGQTTRANVRMAVGQLLDYRRRVPKREILRIAVLLPSAPTPDVQALLDELGIGLVYQTDTGFAGWPLS
ncbi:hypothetical protein ABT160_39265 [Streptomyces sp. NPDC001941]|uniref:hypothetical protein n=1 Tax=Streptomyces sp. NPDC001941 TaxID=3154659 RepID=UPI003323B259